MMSATVGISGAKRNACAAVCLNGEVVAACPQERLTRVRGVGIAGGLPVEAVEEVLGLAGRQKRDVTAYIVPEEIAIPPDVPATILEHHYAHAATSFVTSPFDRAAVLVCDTNRDRELSVWSADGYCLEDQHWPWCGPAFARLYDECASLFEFGEVGTLHAHRLEALAHLSPADPVGALANLFQYRDGRLEVQPQWRSLISGMIRQDRQASGSAARTAAAVQTRIGELLLDLLADVRARIDTDALCLGGGLFYNTYFTTLIRASGIFSDTFVPINPGNGGLAVGASLVANPRSGSRPNRPTVSPFLGRAYQLDEIKNTLDGCKLSYEFVSESEAEDAAIDALVGGQLVGWYHGKMEWGHRALGHRSILANPRSEYVLDNLNSFLRKRERSRPFGLSVCLEEVSTLFCGPGSSRFMEYEYRLRDDRFRHVMPAGASSIRIHTVDRDSGRFWTLLKKMQEATGTGALVNTSFNAFNEPIVCTPRDAIRVFYGSGIDMLVLGQFVLRK